MVNKSKSFMNYAESAKDYDIGYRDGGEESNDTARMKAYYTGVGFGKHKSGDSHLGFNSKAEVDSFNKGVENNQKHFSIYRYKKPTFFERMFRSLKVHSSKSWEKQENKLNSRSQEKHKKYAKKVVQSRSKSAQKARSRGKKKWPKYSP